MELILKTGEKVKLEWSPLVLEYLEDYEGGLEQLEKDIENKNCSFLTFNHIIYSIISASYEKELSYREIVSLVNVNDIDKIIEFVVENVNEMEKTDMTNDSNIKDKEAKFNKHKHRR